MSEDEGIIRGVATVRAKFRLPVSAADGWQLAMGCYAACLAIALLQTPGIFQQAAFTYLHHLPVSETSLAAILTGYAFVTTACLCFGTQALRAAFGMVSVLFWIFFGMEMLAGSVIVGGFLSPGGMFETLGGVGCAMSVCQIGES